MSTGTANDQYIPECFASIRKLNYKPSKIIIVDNGSSDGSIDILSDYPEAHCIKLDKNVGLSKASNIGFAAATTPHIATLNNDMIVDPGWLDRVVDIFTRDSTVGMIGCRQMKYHHRTTIDGLYLKPFYHLGLFPVGSNRDIHHEKRISLSTGK